MKYTLYTEIDDLEPKIRSTILKDLQENEEFVKGLRCARTKPPTRLILTSQRILVHKISSQDISMNDIHLDKIIDVEYKSGTFTKKLIVTDSEGSSNRWIIPDGSFSFVKSLRSYAISSIYSGQPPSLDSLESTSTVAGDGSEDERFAERQSTNEQLSYTKFSPSELKSQLQSMDEYKFEHFLAGLWNKMDWETRVLQASGDAGIDVIATKTEPYPQKAVIQAKRYRDDTTVGGPAIQQYASLKHQIPAVDSVIVVTTSSFTEAAKERANELNVKIIDGDTLTTLIESLDAHNLVVEYLDTSAVPNSSVKPTSDILMKQLPSDKKNLIVWNSGYIDSLYPDNQVPNMIVRHPKYREGELFEWPDKSIMEITHRAWKALTLRNVETGEEELTSKTAIKEGIQTGRAKFIGIPKSNQINFK